MPWKLKPNLFQGLCDVSRVKFRLLSLAVRLLPPRPDPFQPFYFPGHYSVGGVLGQDVFLSLGWAKVVGSWDIAPCLWLSRFSHCALNVRVLMLCPLPGMLWPLLAFFRPQLKCISSLSPSLAAANWDHLPFLERLWHLFSVLFHWAVDYNCLLWLVFFVRVCVYV